MLGKLFDLCVFGDRVGTFQIGNTIYGQQRNNETTNNKTHCSTLKITVLKIRAIQFRNSNKNATDFIYIFNLFTSNILITFTLTSDVKIPLRFVNKFC